MSTIHEKQVEQLLGRIADALDCLVDIFEATLHEEQLTKLAELTEARHTLFEVNPAVFDDEAARQ